MDLHLLALAFFAGLLSAALLSFACLKLLPWCSLSLLGRCRNPRDLELGPAAARVGPESEPDSPKKDPAVPRRFAWAELESLTGSFAAEAVVGEGGFSTVYLARMISSSGLAAVKLHRPSERLRRAFSQELDVLLRLRHPHVVRLLGYCDDCEQGVLVFEYVPNGSLHEKLHGRCSAGEALPWARRMAIAYQIAQALDYLHEGCDPQIVHGDVTASNVLLDERLEPKLCDFGSARLGFSAAVQPPSTTGRSASRRMMGSPGYVDPHYLRSGTISKKSDVYSFGILLLELVTGAEAYDSEREQQMLATAMRPLLKEAADGQRRRVEELVDGRLNGEYDAGEAAAAAEVAAMCVGENPGLRPSMAELVRVLGEKMSSSISAVRFGSDGSKSHVN